MENETKNAVDVLLALVGGVIAISGYRQTIQTWHTDQRWKRAEQLDKYIGHFDTDEQLKRACLILDWTVRKTQFGSLNLTIKTSDVLLALRPHTWLAKAKLDCYPDAQAPIRDALDALLCFFCRLEIAIGDGLIDAEPASRYFRYWLERFVSMDRHPDMEGVLKADGFPQYTPSLLARAYVEVYSDLPTIESLCRRLAVQTWGPPPADLTQELTPP